MNFYHHTERTVAMKKLYVSGIIFNKRREVFDIADDEQLIGCELKYDF